MRRVPAFMASIGGSTPWAVIRRENQHMPAAIGERLVIMARDIERDAAFRPAWRNSRSMPSLRKGWSKPADALVGLGRSSRAASQSGYGERQSFTTAPAQGRPACAAPPPNPSTNPAFAQSRLNPRDLLLRVESLPEKTTEGGQTRKNRRAQLIEKFVDPGIA
jgi:hypothetical protein